MHWIKEHPYLAGGLALGIVVLIFIMRRGSSASAQSVPVASASQSQAELAAATQLSALQTQATVANNKTNAAVAVAQINANAATAAADMQRQVALQNIVTSGQVQFNTNDTNLQLARAQVGGQVQIADINANRDVAIAGTQADVMKSQFESALESQRVISAAAVAQTEAVAKSQSDIAAAQAATQQLGITTAGAVEMHGRDTTLEAYLAQQTANVTEFNRAADLQQNLAEQKYAAGSAYIPSVGGSQNRTAIIASIFGAPGVGVAAEQPGAGQ